MEVTEQEIELNDFDLLLDFFTEAFKLKIVRNERCIKPLFHSFFGVMNPILLVNRGKYSSTRIPIFFIQPSRSGKSEMMKFVKDLINYINDYNYTKDVNGNFKRKRDFVCLPPRVVKYCQKTTEAGLVSLEEYDKIKKQTVLKPGLLETTDLVIYDEGRTLFSKHSNYDDVRMTWNMTLNEDGGGKGEISKFLKSGSVEFKTRATLITGSVPIPEMYEVLDDGFFQRMFNIYQKYTPEECLEMTKRVVELSTVNKWDVENVFGSMGLLIDTWYAKAKEIYPNGHIKVNPNAIGKINILIDEKFKEKLGDFNEEKQNELTSHFIGEMIEKAMKIATHHAILSFKPSVDEDDFKYALEVCDVSIDSITKMILETPTSFKQKSLPEKETLLLSVIEKDPNGISRKDLLKELPVHGWAYSPLTTDKILKRLVEEGKVTVTERPTGKPGAKLKVYILKSEIE